VLVGGEVLVGEEEDLVLDEQRGDCREPGVVEVVDGKPKLHDFWAHSLPEDKRSLEDFIDCVLSLVELGVKRSDPLLRGAADVLLAAWREDGRFRPAPKGAIYPCHTANAARALCRLGHARDRRLRRTFEHLLEVQHDDGGWRCNRAKPGASPETDASNPGVTLSVLDAFRFTPLCNADERLDRAVDALLSHWHVRRPLGPCRFGIGTLFGKVEYPFLRYNLFFYAYVLSFYEAARSRPELGEVLDALAGKAEGGSLVVENPNRGLAKLAFCRKGEPSRLATKRYRELLENVGRRG